MWRCLEKALEMIREKFPIESKLELVDRESGVSIVNENWKLPEIQQISELKMALILSLIRKKEEFENH